MIKCKICGTEYETNKWADEGASIGYIPCPTCGANNE